MEWVVPLEIISPNKKYWIITPAQQAGILKRRNAVNAAKIKAHWDAEPVKPKPPCIVTLERIIIGSQKRMDEKDNLRAAFKYIADTVADLIIPGLPPGQADDPCHGIQWQYSQVREGKKKYPPLLQNISYVRIIIKEKE